MDRVQAESAAEPERDAAERMAEKFASSLYTSAGDVDPEKVRESGRIINTVPWSKNGTWAHIDGEASDADGIRALGILADEDRERPVILKKANTYYLNVAAYPNVHAIRARFGGVVTESADW